MNFIKIICIVLLSSLIVGLSVNLFAKPDEEKENGNTVVVPDDPFYDYRLHNGGVFFNSSHSGVRFNFDGENPSMPSYSENGTLTVDPDGFLKFLRSNEGLSYLSFFGPIIPQVSDDYSVEKIVEFDMRFGGTDKMSDCELLNLFLNCGSDSSSVDFNYNSSTLKVEVPNDDKTEFIEGDVAEFTYTSWNNFRLIYSVEEGKFLFRLYINNQFAACFTSSILNSNVDNINKISFYLGENLINNFIMIDNIYMGYRLK